MPKGKKKKYYAVASGRKPGVYETWDECQAQTKGFSRAVFKSFPSRADAETFIEQHGPKGEEKETSSNKRRRLDGDAAVASAAMRPPPSATLSIVVHFDGGARGNPGLAGAGSEVIATVSTTAHPRAAATEGTTTAGASGKVITTTHIREYCGTHSTNNIAEYTGLLCGLRRSKAEVEDFLSSNRNGGQWMVEVHVRGDSNLIINQMEGTNAVKSDKLKPLHNEATSLVQDMERMGRGDDDIDSGGMVTVSFEHVYRKDNAMADGLANEAMDEQRSWTTSFLSTDEADGVIPIDE